MTQRQMNNLIRNLKRNFARRSFASILSPLMRPYFEMALFKYPEYAKLMELDGPPPQRRD